MKYKYYWLIVVLAIAACGGETKKMEVASEEWKMIDDTTLDVHENDATKAKPIILYENRIGDLNLPFPQLEVLEKLRSTFKDLLVVKEMGQQDGPDFPLYSLSLSGKEVCYFSMDAIDTLKLTEIYINDEFISDAYGIKIGDTYSELKMKRKGLAKIQIDYHQHVWLVFDGSNIMYEISSDTFSLDTLDYSELTLTDELLKDWVIDYIIWKERVLEGSK